MSPSVFMSKMILRMIIKFKNIKKQKNNLKYQEFIKKNFDYVGENFAYEARSIHYKNKKTSKEFMALQQKKILKN